MCCAVCIQGRWLDCVGDLRDALPACEIVKDSHYDKLPPNNACLCGVDIPATLTKAGFDCKWNIAFDEYLAVRKEQQDE